MIASPATRARAGRARRTGPLNVLVVLTDCRSPIGAALVVPYCAALQAKGHHVALAARGLDGRPEGVKAVKLGLGLGWLDLPWAAFQLARAARRLKTDVVHAHVSLQLLPLLWLFKRLTGLPVVGHFHARPRDDSYAPLGWAPLRALFDRLVVPSRRMRSELAGRFPALAPRLRVAPNASSGPARPYVMCVSRLAFDKGLDVLLLAFRSLIDEGRDVDLLICGGDRAPGRPSERRLRDLARRLGLSSRVQFAGDLPRERVAQLLSGCLAFCLPSRWEGHSLSLLEALAAGKPVVATAVGGTEDTLTDGVDGLLVPPGDCEALARAVRRVCGDGALRRRLARGARRRAKDFTHGRHAEACLEALTEAVDEP